MISVCMATYNGHKYIGEQINSILVQLGANDELVISDDGSTDGTIDLISSYNDGRIRLYENDRHHGVVGNFENSLSKARGEYVFLADQDDVWSKEKINTCLPLLDEYDMLVHNALFINASGEEIGGDFFSYRKSKSGFWNNLYRNSYIGCCMCFKKSILDRALPFPQSILWHDMWIGLVAEKSGNVCFLNKPLLYYRRHENNASPTATKSDYSVLFRIRYRMQMLLNILYR